MRLQELYAKYNQDVEFMVVYIKEAHAKSEWWLGETRLQRLANKLFNARVSTEIDAPTTIEERIVNATMAKKAILGDLPTYIDGINDKVNDAYTGLPTRFYLIAKDGTVAWDSGLGPVGFGTEDLDSAIQSHLKTNR